MEVSLPFVEFDGVDLDSNGRAPDAVGDGGAG